MHFAILLEQNTFIIPLRIWSVHFSAHQCEHEDAVFKKCCCKHECVTVPMLDCFDGVFSDI